MSGATFDRADYPGLDIKIGREPVFAAVKIQTAASKVELRSIWESLPRYKYKVTINFVRETIGEAQILMNFFEDRQGEYDSFLFVDPYDSITRRVRFDVEGISMERISLNTAAGGGVTWKPVTIKLVSIKEAI